MDDAAGKNLRHLQHRMFDVFEEQNPKNALPVGYGAPKQKPIVSLRDMGSYHQVESSKKGKLDPKGRRHQTHIHTHTRSHEVMADTELLGSQAELLRGWQAAPRRTETGEGAGAGPPPPPVENEEDVYIDSPYESARYADGNEEQWAVRGLPAT